MFGMRLKGNMIISDPGLGFNRNDMDMLTKAQAKCVFSTYNASLRPSSHMNP